MNYILNHWKGLQPLWQSLGINLFLGTVVIFLFEYFLQRFLKSHVNLYISYWSFIWQSVGTLGACDKNISQYNATGWSRIAQFIVIVGFSVVLIWGLRLGQTIQQLKAEEQNRINEQNKEPSYTLTIDNETLEIDGLLNQGITREVKRLLT